MKRTTLRPAGNPNRAASAARRAASKGAGSKRSRSTALCSVTAASASAPRATSAAEICRLQLMCASNAASNGASRRSIQPAAWS
ncbi:MAG: hypothetical protein U0802_14675 [Candidatus Binatia bacterium]